VRGHTIRAADWQVSISLNPAVRVDGIKSHTNAGLLAQGLRLTGTYCLVCIEVSTFMKAGLTKDGILDRAHRICCCKGVQFAAFNLDVIYHDVLVMARIWISGLGPVSVDSLRLPELLRSLSAPYLFGSLHHYREVTAGYKRICHGLLLPK
jgi:hypothetical protein